MQLDTFAAVLPYIRFFFLIRRADLEVLEVHARHCKFRNGKIRLSINKLRINKLFCITMYK